MNKKEIETVLNNNLGEKFFKDDYVKILFYFTKLTPWNEYQSQNLDLLNISNLLVSLENDGFFNSVKKDSSHGKLVSIIFDKIVDISNKISPKSLSLVNHHFLSDIFRIAFKLTTENIYLENAKFINWYLYFENNKRYYLSLEGWNKISLQNKNITKTQIQKDLIEWKKNQLLATRKEAIVTEYIPYKEIFDFKKNNFYFWNSEYKDLEKKLKSKQSDKKYALFFPLEKTKDTHFFYKIQENFRIRIPYFIENLYLNDFLVIITNFININPEYYTIDKSLPYTEIMKSFNLKIFNKNHLGEYYLKQEVFSIVMLSIFNSIEFLMDLHNINKSFWKTKKRYEIKSFKSQLFDLIDQNILPDNLSFYIYHYLVDDYVGFNMRNIYGHTELFRNNPIDFSKSLILFFIASDLKTIIDFYQKDKKVNKDVIKDIIKKNDSKLNKYIENKVIYYVKSNEFENDINFNFDDINKNQK